jgi:hypothetical protein
MVGFTLAKESTSPSIDLKASTLRPVVMRVPVNGFSISEEYLSGQIQLSAHSQISPTIESYPAVTTPSSYPVPPSPTAEPTANPTGDIEEPYPGPGSREQTRLPYPPPTAGQNAGVIQTPSSQDSSAPPAIESNSSTNLGQDNDGELQTSPALSATILWLGFLASSIIFLSAILWSILTYSRHRNGG